MIILLGASGYIGSAFVREMRRRKLEFQAIARRDWDYTRADELIYLLHSLKPAFVINAAGYTGRPNVDACETAKADTLLGNTILPVTVAHACWVTGVPWGHVSSGCIYTGAKFAGEGGERIERDLMAPGVRELCEARSDQVRGFSEADEPNFSFRHPPCSFYSGSKALAEEAISPMGGEGYIWRLRIPFDGVDSPRNYLTKLLRYPKVYNNFNSITHREDFAGACLDLWLRKAPTGIYNVTNTGYVSTEEVVEMMRRILRIDKDFEFWESDEVFYREAARTPRSNCILDNSKMAAASVPMRDVREALEESLRQWRSEEDAKEM